MRIGAPDLTGALIHELSESFNRSTDMLRNGVASVIRTSKHDRIQHVVSCNSLTRFQMHAGFFDSFDVVRSRDDIVWFAVLDKKEPSHDFGRARRIHRRFRIL